MTDLINDPIYPFFQSTCTITTPTITAGGPTTFCTGGSVNLTSSAGTTYIWSNGATTQSINVTASGTYTVKVTNASGCLSAASAAIIVTVNALPATPTITAGGPTTFCAGGSVTLTSSPEATYLWSNGATTQSINITTAGSYSVRVKNASGCQSAASVATIVTVNALPATPTITAGGPITFCSGGSVTLTSSAGSTYLWSTGATTQSINVTSSGSYTVRVTNANGCQSASSVATIVTVNALPATPTITAGGPITFCAGGNVTLTSSAGTSYLWSNGATTPSINVTTSGSYTVQVKNASGCQSAASAATAVTVNALPITPTITASGPTTFCAGGSVTLTSSAGTSYLWSNGATTQSINITSSGSYTVKVTNANGCQSAASVATVVTSNALPATPTITAGGPTTFCAGGSVTLTSSAGTTYLWSNGAITPSINITSSGSYTVQVTNANGCQSAVSAATIVNVNALPVVNAGTDTTIPNGTSTTINATVAGTGPFTYSWSPSAQLVNASIKDPTTVNLAATTVFTLTATSLTTSCSNTDAVTITISGGALNSTPTATPGTICAGANVQLHALASGGSGSYTYTWTSTPVGFTSSIANPVANPAVTTTYHVAVFDGFTTVNPQVAVTVNALPPTPTITASGPTTFCAGGNVTLTSSAGTSYLWSNGATTPSINITTSGTYTVKVTNASGCLSFASAATVVTVNDIPVTPTITAGGPTTFCAGGNVTLTSSAGTSYLWSNGATAQSIIVTASGSYTVKVTSISGCQSAASVATVVTVNALPGTPTITADGPTSFCTNGNVTLTSSAEASYLWSNGAITPSINITASGSYTVKVTNASGCQSLTSTVTVVTVNALPGTPTITASGPTTFCDGGNVTLTSSAESNYLWSNGAITPSLNITASGSYAVQVTNAYGCQSALSAAINVTVNAVPVTPTITAGGPTTFCDGSSATLTSSEETIYLWSNGATTPSINITSSGSYTVQVSNASGCQSAASVATIVTVNALPGTPTITAESPTTFCDGDVVTLASSPGMDYLWSNGATTQSVDIITAGNYTVQVSNANGCKSAPSVPTVVTVNALPVTTAKNNGPVCAGTALNLTGGPAGMTVYYWTGPDDFTSLIQNPSVSDSATLDMTGTYTLVVANTNGCTNTASQNIVVNVAPVAVPGPDQELKFTFETQMNAELSSDETGEWSLISGSGHISDVHSPTTRITGLSIGENKFLWKVLNGSCEDTAEVKITVQNVFVPSVITPNGDGRNDYFKISEYTGKAELIIVNRWGNEEYSSNNYLNDWDGRNNRGSKLPEDTYFYILKFENGKILKGSVLIKR
jgi:gliding motility-associated-like protein